ncbi:PqqD family peptide modification chaperone [Halovulum dunhuangense]|uniref:PqqD family peptide modification chaperone n=1 Tax=Halovulum dunhuangense TaxID=1505036 RepID=A0A849L230_9RHOB|nr:PqqD family peptide modification chaperone [Halovulum dunhuangense]NNU80366.1 PqqD family peptide modification chaperone [Halovulum dunhuangense]
MRGSFLSQDWYRVAGLKPRLRAHVELHRQRFRGDVWYIVQDLHTGKYHRISPAGNLIVSHMDGRRSVQKLWELACERFEDDPPSQGEVIRLLSQLHAADLIAGDTPPDLEELGRRHHTQERRSMLARLRNPLALRFPLFDPDPFLEATVALARPFFTVWGFVAWLALIVAGVVLAVMNWAPLTEDVVDRVLSAQNVLLLALAFPLVKAIHEFGHAYAAKVWGGEVHEIGLMFLVFIPVPYVDASSSAAFPEKTRRAVVGGAGIMVELALAALALILWLNVEPGLVSAFAFNVMLIGGVSTLLFNGNPLLRFDGYFVMADLVEIPNLGVRSNKYFWYLVQRYLLAVPSAENPVTGRGERPWLFLYAVAAFLYRVSISIAISLFVAQKFFFIGIILAIWALANVFVMPLFKGVQFLLSGEALRGRRGRAWAVTAALGGLAGLGLFAMPVPHRTLAEGVVLLEEDQILRAEVEGFVAAVPQADGAVAPGAPLVTMEDPTLSAETRLASTRLEEMRLRLGSVMPSNQSQANALREQVRFLERRLAYYQARDRALNIAAPRAGEALIPVAADLTGQLVPQGRVLGYVLADGPPRIRVAVPQATAELVRQDTQGVAVMLRRDLDRALPARIIAAAPEGQRMLPSPALGSEAGGRFALDPSDPERLRTVESLFLFDVAPDGFPGSPMVGERVLVRFDHGAEPVAWRIWRGLRQLFLRQFNV